ncbi:hypothetical protein RGQ29_030753, partial [Quercus rubra]
MKKQRKQKKIIKDRDSEDWCFECKDGGKLMICDYRDCLKVYHPECVGKGDSFMENEEPWNCNRHSCLICQNTAKFYCVCCPNAVCGCCIGEVEFAPVKGKKGFCDNCLELLLLAEQNALGITKRGKKGKKTASEEKVDFNGRETYECLFKEYWDIIKGREGLTVDNVYSADAQLKKRGCCSDSVSKAIEFIGWRSSPLIKFLTSIGKDTTKQLSQYDVESIISGYIQEKNLFHPKKKRRILCEPMLYSLFRRKSVDNNQIYSLLDIHFVANLEQSEDDESEDEDEIILGEKKNKNITAAFKKQKTLSSNRTCQEEEVNLTVKESGFASMVAENIKLVYLRKSLVERLLKQPESFDCKVLGSFVRTKTDLTDYQRHTSHQLLQVRGIKKNASEVLLQVSNMPIDLNIAMLSDCDFTK